MVYCSHSNTVLVDGKCTICQIEHLNSEVDLLNHKVSDLIRKLDMIIYFEDLKNNSKNKIKKF